MSSGSFKNVIFKMYKEIINSLNMNKNDLALNHLSGLICYKTKPNQTKTNSKDYS